MNKKNYIVSILITISAIFCSKIDDVTNVGKDLIRDIDNSMVNFEDNFKPITLNVGQSYSIIGNEGENAVHHEGFVAVGSNGNELSTGYFEFVLNSKAKQSFLKSKAIKSICVQFDLDTNNENTKNMNLYMVDTLLRLKRTDWDSTVAVNCGTLIPDSSLTNNKISFMLDSATTASIFSECKNVTACDTSSNEIEQNGCDSLFKILSFVLSNTCSTSVANISRDAKLVFNTVPDSLEKDSVKTLSSSYANYIAYEKNPDPFIQPISSFASKRTAVFETDLTNLWQNIDISGTNMFNEILSVAVKLSGKSITTPIDSLKIQAVISDRTFNSISEMDSIFNYTSTIKGSSSDTLLFQAEKYFQKMISNRPSKAYIYIRSNRFVNGVGIWDRILWDVPKVNVILTTLN